MEEPYIRERDGTGSARSLLLEKRIEALEAWQRDSKQFHNLFYDWQREQIAREAKLDEQEAGVLAGGGAVRPQEAVGGLYGPGGLGRSGRGHRVYPGPIGPVREI